MLQLEPTTTVAEIEEAITHTRASMLRCGRASKDYAKFEAEIERLWDMRLLKLLEADE